MREETTTHDTGLRRALGLRALLVYGIGGMLGGGIYALVGKVAGVAGDRAWICFALAMIVAAPTALSYAELSSRHPRSAGEAWFCYRAFRRPEVSLMVGWLVMCSGVVSMAALAAAFSGYVNGLWPGTPRWAVELAFLGGLSLINARGIVLSSGFNIVCTSVEVLGLIIVICAGAAALGGGGAAPATPATAHIPDPSGVALLQGAALAFYAFLGFEDLVNLAEEVERPQRNVPIAILTGLFAVGIGYMVVTAVSTYAATPEVLATSSAPLVEVVDRGFPSMPRATFGVVALFAVANTALLDFVMASRLSYGMSRQGLLPAWFGRVHASYRTPHHSIAVVFLVSAALALYGSLEELAGATSFLLLAVFATVNLALIRIQRREPRDRDGFSVPRVVPVLGVVMSVGLIGFAPRGSLVAVVVLVAVGAAVVLLRRGLAGAPER